MFTLDHQRDFDAILEATEPFALVRFGDGEAALLAGKAHRAANAEWSSSAGRHWIAPALQESLGRVADRYCVGLPPGCCLAPHVKLHHEARVPVEQRTFATLFLHGNLRRTSELVSRFDPVFVGRHGSILVPDRGVEAPFDYEAIVDEMLATDRPMLVSAGPLANVIIDHYWQRQNPARRQVVLDVGSALDRMLTGKDSRRYHQGWTLDHHCSLGAAPVGLVHPNSARAVTTAAKRPEIPAAEKNVTSNVQAMEPKRMRNVPVIIGRKGTPMPKRNYRAALVVHDGRRHGQPPAVSSIVVLERSVAASAPAAAPAVDAAAAQQLAAAAVPSPMPKKRKGRCANCSKVVRSRR